MPPEPKARAEAEGEKIIFWYRSRKILNGNPLISRYKEVDKSWGAGLGPSGGAGGEAPAGGPTNRSLRTKNSP